MKKYIRCESYNYGSHYIIEYTDDGWCVFEYGEVVAGPYRSWYAAQEWVDLNDPLA